MATVCFAIPANRKVSRLRHPSWVSDFHQDGMLPVTASSSLKQNAVTQDFVIFKTLIGTQTIVDKICYAVKCT